MRHVVSTALVALIGRHVTVTAVGAVAQAEPAPLAATEPAAVSAIDADKVDARHAVGSGASRAKRAGKLVATNKNGYLPKNIVKGLITRITLTQVTSASTPIPAGRMAGATATCPAGTAVAGGSSGDASSIHAVRSYRTSDATGWNVSTLPNASRTASPMGWMASTSATPQPMPRRSSPCPMLDGMKVGRRRMISSRLGTAVTEA